MTKGEQFIVDKYRRRTLHTDWEIHEETGIPYDDIVKHKTTNTIGDQIKNGTHKTGKWTRV